MSNDRKPIQTTLEVHQSIEELKLKKGLKNGSDAISYLLNYHKKTVIEVPEDLKKELGLLRQHLGMRSDVSLIRFLISHYSTSPSLSKDTFEIYMKEKA